MDEPKRGRAKPQKLRVTFPDGTIYCYSSVKETFLATLRKIGADKLSRVKLEVCHLPMFSQTVYELYKDFMEPIGDGWYVNTQGSTYNRYSQLVSINNQLGLDLTIDLSPDIKGEKISRGSRGLSVLEVIFPDHTTIGEENTAETFMQCIWHIGIDRVKKLNLKQGGRDLITSSNLYKGQVQIDENRWLIIPAALKDKVKILRVISAMLHIKMDITSFSTNESKSYKRIGSKSSHRQKVEEIRKQTGGKFNLGDHIYNDVYGEGVVLEYDELHKTYKVQFSYKFKDLPKEDQIYTVRERNLVFIREGIAPKATEVPSKKIKNDLNPTKTVKKNLVDKFYSSDIVYHPKYGKGQIISHPYGTHVYNVRFSSLPKKENTRLIFEGDLILALTKQASIVPTLKKDEATDYKRFNAGDKVWNKRYGIGIVQEYYPKIHDYKVQFYKLFQELPVEKQSILIHEKFLEPYRGKEESSQKETEPKKSIVKDEVKESVSKVRPKTRQNVIKRHVPVFKEGDIVSHMDFGIGIVRYFFNGSNTYGIQFLGLPVGQQEKVLKGEDLNLVREHQDTILVSITPRPASQFASSNIGQHVMSDVVVASPKYKKGDLVYNERYGKGKILDYIEKAETYRVYFSVMYKGRLMFEKICMIKENDLKPVE